MCMCVCVCVCVIGRQLCDGRNGKKKKMPTKNESKVESITKRLLKTQ